MAVNLFQLFIYRFLKIVLVLLSELCLLQRIPTLLNMICCTQKMHIGYIKIFYINQALDMLDVECSLSQIAITPRLRFFWCFCLQAFIKCQEEYNSHGLPPRKRLLLSPSRFPLKRASAEKMKESSCKQKTHERMKNSFYAVCLLSFELLILNSYKARSKLIERVYREQRTESERKRQRKRQRQEEQKTTFSVERKLNPLSGISLYSFSALAYLLRLVTSYIF